VRKLASDQPLPKREMSKRFTVQISDDLNTWLEEQARLNHRSKNKQIEHLLNEAMQKPSPVDAARFSALQAQTWRKIGEK
jgi:hypothetical protein